MKINGLLIVSLLAFLPACEKTETIAKKSSITPPIDSPAVPNTPESIAKEIASLQDQLAVIMESITDVPTAEKAIVEVVPVAGRFNAVGKVIEGRDKNTAVEDDARLKALVKPAEERLQNAMAKAMPILTQNPGLAEKMQAAMSKMNSN
jgi:hypothetical protein